MEMTLDELLEVACSSALMLLGWSVLWFSVFYAQFVKGLSKNWTKHTVGISPFRLCDPCLRVFWSDLQKNKTQQQHKVVLIREVNLSQGGVAYWLNDAECQSLVAACINMLHCAHAISHILHILCLNPSFFCITHGLRTPMSWFSFQLKLQI